MWNAPTYNTSKDKDPHHIYTQPNALIDTHTGYRLYYRPPHNPYIVNNGKLDALEYPDNPHIRARVSELEWKLFTATLRSVWVYSKKYTPHRVVATIIVIIGAVVASQYVPSYWYLVIIGSVVLCYFANVRFRNGRLTKSMNGLYRTISLFNKYLFRDRGLQVTVLMISYHMPFTSLFFLYAADILPQIRMQLRVQRAAVSEGVLYGHIAHCYIKIDISHPATCAALMEQHPCPLWGEKVQPDDDYRPIHMCCCCIGSSFTYYLNENKIHDNDLKKRIKSATASSGMSLEDVIVASPRSPDSTPRKLAISYSPLKSSTGSSIHTTPSSPTKSPANPAKEKVGDINLKKTSNTIDDSAASDEHGPDLARLMMVSLSDTESEASPSKYQEISMSASEKV